MDQFQRTRRLIGEDNQSALQRASVAVFGLGGVGSYVVEALARAGIGRMMLVDGDCVDVTNINRQLLATHETIGLAKSEVAKARVRSINPAAQVDARSVFYRAENCGDFDFSSYDYIVDAIDSVPSKLALIVQARLAGVPILCSMGAGNKLNPAAFEVADIEKTSVCPLARVMRRELRARGIQGVKVVYSKEMARPSLDGERAPGSISFVPSAAGLVLAGEVIRSLIHME